MDRLPRGVYIWLLEMDLNINNAKALKSTMGDGTLPLKILQKTFQNENIRVHLEADHTFPARAVTWKNLAPILSTKGVRIPQDIIDGVLLLDIDAASKCLWCLFQKLSKKETAKFTHNLKPRPHAAHSQSLTVSRQLKNQSFYTQIDTEKTKSKILKVIMDDINFRKSKYNRQQHVLWASFIPHHASESQIKFEVPKIEA